jgi:hypothetical protein
MSAPGFTAEVSLYKTSEHYHMIESAHVSESREVLPQLAVSIKGVDPYCFNDCYHVLGNWQSCQLLCRGRNFPWEV